MKTRERLLLIALVLAPACGLASCGAEESRAALPDSDVPESFFLASAPSGAKSVGEVVASSQDGDSVVVTGRVGGAHKVFVDGYAAFSIVDASVQPCGADNMDDCPTPWDYCCETPEELAAKSLSVELAAEGKVLAARPRGFHGLDHLKTVVVAGRVDKDDAGNVRVLATGLHVVQ